MKKVFLSVTVFLFVASFTACTKNENAGGTTDGAKNDTTQAAATPPAQEEYVKKAEALPRTTVKFDNETFDFKVIKEGDEVPHRFNFENTGANDLVITNVKPSCGCTTPSWSQEPVKAGQKGFIDVKFNSAGKSGQQTKTITVTGNFEGDINKSLKLIGEVKAKDKPADGAAPKEEKH